MQRPTSVTVFGVLNIVFAGFGIIGVIAAIVMFATMDESSNPIVRIMRESPGFAAWMKLSLPLNLAATAALLTSGIGLLGMRSWARKLTLGYAIYAIVFGVIGTAVNAMCVMGPMLEEASHLEGPEAAGAMGGAIGGTVGGCIGLIYPILLLVFLTRPKFVAAFHPSVPSPES